MPSRSLVGLILVACAPMLPGQVAHGPASGADATNAVRGAWADRRQQRDTPPVFRAGADLFVIDAVVTNRGHQPVTNLSADDFEVTVNGRRQAVRHAVYVPFASAPDKGFRPQDRSILRAPAARPTAGAIGRTIAIVVDDLGLSFEGTYAVRTALGRFIDVQLRPEDLVAILRTSGGVGTLQQFTTDRRLLHAAAERVQWTGFGRKGVGAFDAIGRELSLSLQPPGQSSTSAAIGPERRRDKEDTLEGLRETMLTVGTLGALEYAIRGLTDLPGRKSVVLMAEGFDLFDRQGQTRVWDAVRRLIDAANRAGVVLYTIDARGLQTGGQTAEDASSLATARGGRLTDLLHSQEGLLWLAEQTGGFAVVNNNDLHLGLSRVLADQHGYYLVGYEGKDPGARGSWEPGRVQVHVRGNGLRVRWRQGLFGPADSGRTPESERDPLVAAAMSPFTATDVTVRLTALFAYSDTSGPYVRTLLFVDPDTLTLTRSPSGDYEGRVEVLTIGVGDSGQLAGRWQQRSAVRLNEAEYRRARERGLVYSGAMRVRGNGGFQVRAVLRDTPSGRVGSGSQFLHVSAVGRGKLTLSGVLMRGHVNESGPAVLRPEGDDAVPEALLAQPTVRIFRPGSTAYYAYEIYSGLRPRDRLTISSALLRDGRRVYESPPAPVTYSTLGTRVERVPIAGSLELGNDMLDGTYTLQVTVNADRPGRRDLGASQWVDFEVLRR